MALRGLAASLAATSGLSLWAVQSLTPQSTGACKDADIRRRAHYWPMQ
jgi:predicted aconitase